MTLNICVLTLNRIVWNSEVNEIILSNNSGQIGVLPNHALIATAVDIGILRIRLNDQWLTMALMGGFARIGNNETNICNASKMIPNGELQCQEFPTEIPSGYLRIMIPPVLTNISRES